VIGVIINPHAGRNRGERGRLERLREIVGGSGVVFEPTSLDELDTVVQQFATRGVDVLGVCGGDGSFFRSLSSAVRIYGPDRMPRFLPLRAGSMNTIARAVRCRAGGPEAVLAAVVDEQRSRRPSPTTERQLICINGDQFGFMTGAGAAVRFLQAYYDGDGRGPVAAAMTFGRAITSAISGTPFSHELLGGVDARMVCDGAAVTQTHFNFLYASSINEIGLGIQVTYRGDERRGFFHLIGADIRPAQVVRRIGRLWRGRPLALPTVVDRLVQSVHIEFPQPTHYMVDGDVLGAVHHLDLSSGPRLEIVL